MRLNARTGPEQHHRHSRVALTDSTCPFCLSQSRSAEFCSHHHTPLCA